MPIPSRFRATLACLVATAVLPTGCSALRHESESASGRRPVGPREECRAAFATCAPDVKVGDGIDVSKLTIRKLVYLSARLDVPDDLAASAAKRLEGLAGRASEADLLEIEAAMDDTGRALGKCRCKEFRSELDKRGIAELLAARLPAREMRSPEYWVEPILAKLEALRVLTRRSAGMVAAGGAAGEDPDGQKGRVRQDLCETVHTAQARLAADAFARMLETVYRENLSRVGEGSAAVAKRLLDEQADSSSCEAPAPASAPAPAPADEEAGE